jgi:hypothetical protein
MYQYRVSRRQADLVSERANRVELVTRVKSTLSTSYNKCNYQVPNKELYYNATFVIKKPCSSREKASGVMGGQLAEK